MARKLAVLFVLVLIPLMAIAQDETEADEAGLNYIKYEAADYGFNLDLPENGTIADPKSEDWTEDEEVAFEWYGDADAPIVLIQGRVDEFETTLDAQTFKLFCDSLLSNWSEDKANFDLVTANKMITLGEYEWNLIEVADKSHGSEMVYYSLFSMYNGTRVYSISLYYLSPLNDEILDFGIPVIDSMVVAE